MRTDITTKELRTNLNGQPVLDVIFSDGTKVKLDREKLAKKKTEIANRQHQIDAESAIVDEQLAMIDAEINA